MAGDVSTPQALIDTGAILAILNARDPWHRLCIDTIRQLPLPLLTSEAVLTELFHLAGSARHEMEAAWTFIRSGAIALATIAEDELPRLHELMTRYSDRPMDFADATLVYLAKRESISTIFTVDHADFSTYRIEGKRKFRILPLDRPGR
jgi:predicted nucleic acid-binding protein